MTETPDLRLARRVDVPNSEHLTKRSSGHLHPQHEILAIPARPNNVPPIVHSVLKTVEKTYTSIEQGVVPPLETTLKAMHNISTSACPNYLFEESTQHDQSGLGSTLAAVLPPLPPSMVFGKIDPEDRDTEMVRRITAHHLWERCHISPAPEDVYQPTHGWWLLVISLDDISPVSPTTLWICLENFPKRTSIAESS